MAAGLERFVDAQDRGGSLDAALAELAAGRKTGHWIWWVFPQLAGLGSSPTSRTYGIADLAEAEAYAAHPVLGPRLAVAARLLLDCAARRRTAVDVLGDIDACKVRSSMTLFEVAAPDAGPWSEVLDAWYLAERDPHTLRMLGSLSP